MTLREKRELFTWFLSLLIEQAWKRGFTATIGEVYRSAAEAKRLAETGAGIVKSLHTEGLAVDLNLYRSGKYLTRTEDYLVLGEWWEAQHPLCRWGGRFTKPDGNHFSVEHDGRR
ncbi:MAG: M15 family metallopeptidase [Gemmatimonadota bacterium]|nr:M15 family metallopeptidase [Gemmatimonadota bacterium]